MKVKELFFITCVLFMTTGRASLAQDTQNQRAVKQQRLRRINELRLRDEQAIRSKVHPDVRQKTINGETVRVIVHLNVPLKRTRNPTQVDDLENKTLITKKQDELLSVLRQRKYKILRRYDYFPLLSLELGSEALDVLENSPIVLRVQESRMNRLALNQSVPRVGAPQVWAAPTNITGAGWTVAIIDTGVSHSHPFLQENNATIVVNDEACYQ